VWQLPENVSNSLCMYGLSVFGDDALVCALGELSDSNQQFEQVGCQFCHHKHWKNMSFCVANSGKRLQFPDYVWMACSW